MLGGEKGRIVIESSPECDDWRCPERWENVRVYDPGNRRLLSTIESYDPDGSALDVRCKDGSVVCRYQQPLTAQPAASGAAPALAAPPRLPPPLNRIFGLDDRVRERMELLLARECIHAGEWLDAAAILEEGAPGAWSGPHHTSFDWWRGAQRLHFSPESQARRRELLLELARLREETRPLDIVERRSLGGAPLVLATPLDPGKRAALFWRGPALCVVQDGDAPRAMRCYDPARRRWSAPSPIAWPSIDGQLLEEPRPLAGPPWDYCDAPQAMQMRIRGDRLDADCWYDPDQIVALLEGPSLLLSGLVEQLAALKQLRDKPNFGLEDTVVSLPESAQVRYEADLNGLLDRLLAELAGAPTKTLLLKHFAQMLEKFEDEDSEIKDRALEYLEEIMDALGIESSDGLLNTWRYGFDPTVS